jgi:hypothetical protein
LHTSTSLKSRIEIGVQKLVDAVINGIETYKPWKKIGELKPPGLKTLREETEAGGIGITPAESPSSPVLRTQRIRRQLVTATTTAAQNLANDGSGVRKGTGGKRVAEKKEKK